MLGVHATSGLFIFDGIVDKVLILPTMQAVNPLSRLIAFSWSHRQPSLQVMDTCGTLSECEGSATSFSQTRLTFRDYGQFLHGIALL